jgi:trehalose-phosphatase
MTEKEGSVATVIQIPDFWELFKQNKPRFLGLDYDGTLAPFHVDPMKARPLPGVTDLVSRLAADDQTRVAIISGRPVVEVMALLGNPRVTIIGSHGFELWPVDGVRVVRQPQPNQQEGLETIRQWIEQQPFQHKLERKVASLAVHTRGLDPVEAVTIEEHVAGTWSEQVVLFDLECRRFNGGVEIRCAGWDKGAALTELLSMQPENVWPVYVGDDDTDEDAFTVLRGRGVGIKVGDASWPTAALGFLPDCQAVVNFLRTWVELTDS